MKRLIAATCLLLWSCLSPTQALAQNCKPDLLRDDKITKERVVAWNQVLFSTSFGSNLLSSSTGKITAIVGRVGTLNIINIQIEKRERSAMNAMLESARRGAVGQSFYLGFKDGEPLGLTVSSVNNQAARGKGLADDQIITTVVLSATVEDARMADLRPLLTSKSIDAVRMNLAGELQVEESVSEKNGEGMRAKFTCFYQFLEQSLVGLSAGPGPAQSAPGQSTSVGADGGPSREYAASAAGKYVYQKNTSSYIELQADGSSSIHTGGKDYRGNYAVKGDTIVLKGSFEGQAVTSSYRLNGNAMISVNNGGIWEREKQREPQSPKSVGAPLTIDQVIQMVAAKLPDDIIIATIGNSSSRFELTPEILIKLKTAGVSDAVLRAMAR